jgi:hypothetical protein
LPVPVQLARKVYRSIKPRLDRIAEEGLLSWPHNPLLDPVSEHAEGIAESRPEFKMRRMTRSSRVRSGQPLETLQASPLLTPDSPEVEPQAPSVQKSRSGWEKKTSRKASISSPQLDPGIPSSLSRAPGVALKAPQPPKVSGVTKKASRRPVAGHIPSVTAIPEAEPASPPSSATSGTPQPPAAKRAAANARRTKVPQTHSNGTVGSGVAGPSTSAPVDQPLYPPALAQRIWDLAEAGKYNAALGLFKPQEGFRQITGEAAVQEYLSEHPEAGKLLRPLTTGRPRKELFLCRSKTFWVPTEGEEKKEGSRSFVLEHRTTDCAVGYATQDNLYKHIYKFHLKKIYSQYPKKGSSGTEPKKPAKGKASQTREKGRASKRDEDDYADEVDED